MAVTIMSKQQLLPDFLPLKELVPVAPLIKKGLRILRCHVLIISFLMNFLLSFQRFLIVNSLQIKFYKGSCARARIYIVNYWDSALSSSKRKK